MVTIRNPFKRKKKPEAPPTQTLEPTAREQALKQSLPRGEREKPPQTLLPGGPQVQTPLPLQQTPAPRDPNAGLLSGEVSSAQPLIEGIAGRGALLGLAPFVRTAGRQAGGAVALKRIPVDPGDLTAVGKGAISNLKRFGKRATSFAVPILTTAYVVNEFLLSPSELATWAAVDNVAGLISFQVKNAVDGVERGTATIEEAQSQIQEAQQHIQGARSYVEKTTMLNPKLWAGRNVLIGAIDVAENGVFIQSQRLDELANPEAVFVREQQAAAFARRNEVLNIRAGQGEGAQ